MPFALRWLLFALFLVWLVGPPLTFIFMDPVIPPPP